MFWSFVLSLLRQLSYIEDLKKGTPSNTFHSRANWQLTYFRVPIDKVILIMDTSPIIVVALYNLKCVLYYYFHCSSQ